MEIIDSYKNWLRSRSYSDATIRNYLVDVNKYLSFIENCKLKIENSNYFSQENLSTYLGSIKGDSNYSRYSSSLSKFFQFALDQNLISENPFSKALKNTNEPLYPPLNDIIQLYQHQLEKKKFSISTIRNYINDIQQFINWAQSSPIQNPPSSDKSESTSLDREANKSNLIFKFFKKSSPVKGRSPQDRGVLIET